jgi:F-type H+-transporting ATPase subunit b
MIVRARAALKGRHFFWVFRATAIDDANPVSYKARVPGMPPFGHVPASGCGVVVEFSPDLMVLQAIPFLTVVAGLHLIIFKPMLAMLAEREKNIHGYRKEAELMQEEVDTKMSELEVKLAEARAEATAERGRLRQESLALEQQTIQAARTRAEGFLEEARQSLSQERAAAASQLRETAAELSEQIATSVLGRSVGGN